MSVKVLRTVEYPRALGAIFIIRLLFTATSPPDSYSPCSQNHACSSDKSREISPCLLSAVYVCPFLIARSWAGHLNLWVSDVLF